jgi:hypothetical protein
MRLLSVFAFLLICIAAIFFFGIGERPQEPPAARAKKEDSGNADQ